MVAISHVWRVSPVAQTVRSLPTVRETWVPFLGREDPLEKEIATHSSISVYTCDVCAQVWMHVYAYPYVHACIDTHICVCIYT